MKSASIKIKCRQIHSRKTTVSWYASVTKAIKNRIEGLSPYRSFLQNKIWRTIAPLYVKVISLLKIQTCMNLPSKRAAATTVSTSSELSQLQVNAIYMHPIPNPKNDHSSKNRISCSHNWLLIWESLPKISRKLLSFPTIHPKCLS